MSILSARCMSLISSRTLKVGVIHPCVHPWLEERDEYRLLGGDAFAAAEEARTKSTVLAIDESGTITDGSSPRATASCAPSASHKRKASD